MNSQRQNSYDSKEAQFDEIKKEYSRIDNDWLEFHYMLTIWMVVFAFIVECILGVIMMNSDMLISSTVPQFILKYIIIPSGLNLFLIGVSTYIIKHKHISLKSKIYGISLVLVGICFVLFTAHNAFTATYYIFTVAIVLTAIYASYQITSITALASIVALVLSELFIQWDLDKVSIYESTHRLGDFLISIFIMIAFSIVCMILIRYEQKKIKVNIQMQIERHELQHSLQVDELTGILNRKALFRAMSEIEEGEDKNYILAISDIDHFKGINDTWGHTFGDRCLSEFARILTQNNAGAVAYRFGGDEFCLLFHDTDMEIALSACNDIQAKLKELKFEENDDIKLTASFGLAEYTDKIDATELLVHSDHALYEAKVARNTIRVSKRSD